MPVMLLLVNALLYVFALTLAVAVVSPMPADASRRARVARATLACGGGSTVVAAIALGFVGLWFESALAGTLAIIVVGTCMCVGLAGQSANAAAGEDEDEDDDGGSLYGPAAPDPTKPEGGPSDDSFTDWTEFDRARAGWAREREPTTV
jgi:hypothetical protein